LSVISCFVTEDFVSVFVLATGYADVLYDFLLIHPANVAISNLCMPQLLPYTSISMHHSQSQNDWGFGFFIIRYSRE
jgi:hypothetical protein